MSGIYIHIPFCKQKCTYCDFTSFPDKLAFAEAYMACLYKEMQLRAEQCKERAFDTVYIGGGTLIFTARLNRLKTAFGFPKIPKSRSK